MPASRHQDHTTSPYAGDTIRLLALLHPSRPVPNVRDDREAPLVRDRMRAAVLVIWPRAQAEHFWRQGWTQVLRDLPDGLIWRRWEKRARGSLGGSPWMSLRQSRLRLF